MEVANGGRGGCKRWKRPRHRGSLKEHTIFSNKPTFQQKVLTKNNYIVARSFGNAPPPQIARGWEISKGAPRWSHASTLFIPATAIRDTLDRRYSNPRHPLIIKKNILKQQVSILFYLPAHLVLAINLHWHLKLLDPWNFLTFFTKLT